MSPRGQLTLTERIYEGRSAFRGREEISGLIFYPSIEWVFFLRNLLLKITG